MDLKDAILLIPPREQSGSDMADRVAYQIDWVLSKILELHQADDDYLIVLEHQDDVILLNSEASPTTIDFYQVKTKDGKYWLAGIEPVGTVVELTTKLKVLERTQYEETMAVLQPLLDAVYEATSVEA